MTLAQPESGPKDASAALPPGWSVAAIGSPEVCEINPRRLPPGAIPPDSTVTFVPMAAVDADTGSIAMPESRVLADVRSGFTAFAEGDVIMAKITPCMENGKAAVCRSLENGLGFGSTEFHVLRPGPALLAEYLFHYIRQVSFRREAEGQMTGTVGQKRVPAAFIADHELPIPPLDEQRRIVTVLDGAFAQLDAAAGRLARVFGIMKRYRASVLSAAVEGRLTEDWRAEHAGEVEPASEFLARILAERRTRWEAEQEAKFARSGKTPPFDWRSKYSEPVGPASSELPELPDDWCWAQVSQIGEIQGGIQKQPSRAPRHHIFPFLRVANVLRGRLDLSNVHRVELYEGELERLRLQPGDLLVVEGNGSASEIGRMAVWRGAIEDCVHQNHIIRIRPVRATIPNFVEAYWNSPTGAQAMRRGAVTSAGLLNLSVSKIAAIPLPLPPLIEQQEIVRRVEKQLRLADAVEARVQRAAGQVERMRQSLLAKAFRGELVPQDPNDEPTSVAQGRMRTAMSLKDARGKERKG